MVRGGLIGPEQVTQRDAWRSDGRGRNSRRRRKGLNRLRKTGCGQFRRRPRNTKRHGDWRRPREDEEHCCRQRFAALVAAGHGALHRVRFVPGGTTLVFAPHRCFRRSRVNGHGLICFLVFVRRSPAETVGTTPHGARLQSHRPERGPKQHHRQQAHPTRHFPSRNDRNVERPVHGGPW
jgi:hypothetical protein